MRVGTSIALRTFDALQTGSVYGGSGASDQGSSPWIGGRQRRAEIALVARFRSPPQAKSMNTRAPERRPKAREALRTETPMVHESGANIYPCPWIVLKSARAAPSFLKILLTCS